jgi:hypothetical protein
MLNLHGLGARTSWEPSQAGSLHRLGAFTGWEPSQAGSLCRLGAVMGWEPSEAGGFHGLRAFARMEPPRAPFGRLAVRQTTWWCTFWPPSGTPFGSLVVHLLAT